MIPGLTDGGHRRAENTMVKWWFKGCSNFTLSFFNASIFPANPYNRMSQNGDGEAYSLPLPLPLVSIAIIRATHCATSCYKFA